MNWMPRSSSSASVWQPMPPPASEPSGSCVERVCGQPLQKCGLRRSVAGMVMVELLLVATGIGLLLLESSGSYRGDMVFAIVMAIMIEAVLLITAVRKLEKLATPWAGEGVVRD